MVANHYYSRLPLQTTGRLDQEADSREWMMDSAEYIGFLCMALKYIYALPFCYVFIILSAAVSTV